MVRRRHLAPSRTRASHPPSLTPDAAVGQMASAGQAAYRTLAEGDLVAVSQLT